MPSGIGQEWSKSSDSFNEFYYLRAISRALIFRATEKLVSSQPWYNGGYRANIVAYAIAALSEIIRRQGKTLDSQGVWSGQSLPLNLVDAVAIAARFVNDEIVNPPAGISNISEWCKKDLCWTRIQNRLAELEPKMPADFLNGLLSKDDEQHEIKSAKKVQKIDDGIACQKKVFALDAEKWKEAAGFGLSNNLLNQKDMAILATAAAMPERIPSEKQCIYLVNLLRRLELEGLML